MRFSNRPAKIIFAISALVFMGLSLILYLHIDDLIYASNRAHYTHVIRLKLEQLLSNVKNAETAQRGYLLTNDSTFLDTYTNTHTNTKALLKELDSITKDNKEQQVNITVLRSLITVRYTTFNKVITEYQKPTQNELTQQLFLQQGKTSMDNIRQRVQYMISLEEQLMAKRKTVRDRKSFLTPLFAFFLILSSLTILLFSYLKVIKELNKSKNYLANLKTLNEELQSKNQALELYNKELDSFSYIASHDLKEPLRKIQFYTAKLQDEEPTLSQIGRESLQRIDIAAIRMQNLLKDLLHYSFYANNETAEFIPVSLGQIIHEVEESLNDLLVESHAIITNSELPTVSGLPFQLKQLFENLITNSIKFKSATNPVISISSSLIKKETIRKSIPASAPVYHKIIYRDNGIGFEQTYAHKIFALFQQLHPKDGYGGTGMGLTICKKIVQNHNGFIEAFSRPNNGAVFEIYLPA
jgi:signal transduction histidine kinase